MPLRTDRLLLLPWSQVTDAQCDGLVAAWDDPEVWRYVGAGRERFTRADLDSARRRAEERGLVDCELVVVRAGDGAVMRVCGLYPSWLDGGDPDDTDLGYRFGRAFWGRGYGLEAAAAVVRWGVEERGLGFRPLDVRPVPSDPTRLTQWYQWRA